MNRRATATVVRETNCPGSCRVLLPSLLLLGLVALPVGASDVVIDSFADGMALLDAPPTDQSFVAEAADNMIGTERDLRVERVSFMGGGVNSVLGGPSVTAEVTGGELLVDMPVDTRGEVLIVWDDSDDDITLDPEGLGGVDLTDGGLNSGLRLRFSAVTGIAEVTAEIHTDADFASRAVGAATAAGDLVLSASAFQPIGALGAADFTSVGAVVVRLTATEASAKLTEVAMIPPVLMAEKDDLDPVTGVGLGDTPVAPGATVRYRMTISNSGAEAVAVDLNDMIDPNTTLGGAVRSTPIAAPDGYSVLLDTVLTVDNANLGVLANDNDPDAEVGTLTVSAADTQSIQSPTPNVTVNSDGTFTYTPPPGFDGVDAFGYTLSDGDAVPLTATGQVTILVLNASPMLAPTSFDVAFVEDGGAVAIAPGITVTDANDATLASATVTLTNLTDAGEEFLAAATGGTSIVALYTAPTLTLTGPDTVANFQNVLRSVTYENVSVDPAESPDRVLLIVANDGDADSNQATSTVTVAAVNEPPVVGADSYTTVGHVELTAGGAAPTSLARVVSATNILTNDSDGEEGSPLTLVGLNGTVGTPPLTGDSTLAPMADGNVTLAADGSFIYVPPVGIRGTVDTFTYTVSDGIDSGTGTVSITIVDELVWFVHNDAAGEILNPSGGDGRSSDPFDKLSDADGAPDDPEDASAVDEHIFVFEGDGTNTNQNSGITLKTDQILLGHATATTTIGGVVIQTPNPPTATANPPGDRPVIGHGAGVGAVVENVTGVVIRDLEIGASSYPIHVINSGANDAGATIANNVIASEQIAFRGQHDSTGTTTLMVENNTFLSDAIGAEVLSSAGTVELYFSNNIAETDDTRAIGMVIDGGMGGDLNIRQFSGNSVNGGSTGLGILVSSATFDADGATAGFQTVAGGTTTIGSAGAGNRVSGAGMSLGSVRGRLHFDQLDIFSGGLGGGLRLDNSTLAVSDFGLNIDAGTVVTAGGLALDLDPATVATTFTSVQSSGTGAGVSLVDLAGTVTILDGSINSMDATTAFHVSGGTAAISYAGTIDNTAGRSVLVQSRPVSAGNVTFSGVVGNLAATSGSGILVTNNAGGTVVFAGGLNLATAANDALSMTNNTGATVQLSGGFDIDTTSGSGFVASGGGVISATTGTNTIDTTTGSAILVDGNTLNATFTDVNVTAGETVAVSFNNSPGTKTFADLDLTVNLGGGGMFAPFGGGAKSAPGSTAFFASNAGVLSLQGSGNTLDVEGGTGICWINTDLTTGAHGFSTLEVTDTGESNPALIFDGLGGGSLETTATIARTGSPDFSASGLEIRNSTSTFVFDSASSIADTSGTAFLAGAGTAGSGGNNSITYLGTITNGLGRSVLVQRRSGGAVAFGGLIDDTGRGILLDTFTGGSTTFRGGLDLDTSDRIAFQALSAGTVNVCATIDCAAGVAVNNEIGADAPVETTAVHIDTTTIGANHVTFRSISVDQASPVTDEAGIILRSTGATGDFRVTGDGSSSPIGSFGGNGSGGTLENFLDVDAVTLDTVGGRVHLQNMIIEDISDSSDGGDPIGTRSARDGIHGQALTGGLTLDSVTIRRVSDNAINGSIFADGISATSFSGLEIRNSLLENTNRFHVANRGDDGDESMVRIVGMTGNVRVDNSRFRLGAGAILLASQAGNGTLDITVQRSRFEDLYKEFNTGVSLNVGRRGLDFTANGSHDVVARIGDPAESNPALGNLFVNNFTASIAMLGQEGGLNPHTGDIDVVISHNTFRITDHTTPQAAPGNFQFNFPQGGVALGPGGGTYDAIVSNNLFDQVMHAAGGLGQLSLGLNGGNSQVRVSGNTFQLPWDAPVQIRADGNSSAAVLFENNTYVDGTVGSASDDLGAPSQSPFNPFLVNVLAGGSLDLTLRNEDLPQHDIVFTPGDRRHSIEVEVQADNAGNTIDLHLQSNTAPEGYHLKRFNGTFNLFRGASASNVPATIVDDNGNTGGGSNAATDPPVVPVDGTINAVGTAPTLPVIVIP